MHSGDGSAAHRELPRLSQQTLADIVGATTSRVRVFMNKFKRLGYIEYRCGLKVTESLVAIIAPAQGA